MKGHPRRSSLEVKHKDLLTYKGYIKSLRLGMDNKPILSLLEMRVKLNLRSFYYSFIIARCLGEGYT